MDLYCPYVYITTTDYCEHRLRQGFFKVANCLRSCRNVSNVRKVRMGKEWVYTHGNTQFYLNESLHTPIPAQVDRVVKVVF